MFYCTSRRMIQYLPMDFIYNQKYLINSINQLCQKIANRSKWFVLLKDDVLDLLIDLRVCGQKVADCDKITGMMIEYNGYKSSYYYLMPNVYNPRDFICRTYIFKPSHLDETTISIDRYID